MSDIIKEVLATKQMDDLKLPQKVTKPLPELTKENVSEAVELLKDVQNNNGHLSIAAKVGLTQNQIREIHKAMSGRIAELTPKPKEELGVA